VLLVDDQHHRTPLLRALRDQKHTVLCADDDAGGENLFGTSQIEIDALVACADMNRMSGFELARRLRRVRPEIRVLLMCRHFAGPDEAHAARERGYPVIEEPFTPEDLCRRLVGLLASQRNDSCTELLDREDRLIPREDEVLAIGSKKEDWLPKEVHPWNRAKAEIWPTDRRRSCERRRRSRAASGANDFIRESIGSPFVPPARQGIRRCDRWR
jgi:DNA-binding response OmpR family regulator